MYIHGPFGTGKSFILGAIANQLKAKSVASTIVYLPEYIRTLKVVSEMVVMKQSYNEYERQIY